MDIAIFRHPGGPLFGAQGHLRSRKVENLAVDEGLGSTGTRGRYGRYSKCDRCPERSGLPRSRLHNSGPLGRYGQPLR